MIWLALYLFTIVSFTSGALGHPPLLARAARQTLTWRPGRGSRGSASVRTAERRSDARLRPRPSWAHTQPINHEWDEAA